jgi:5'-3' exonuclease
MGIANLNKFLRGKCPEVFRQISLSELHYVKASVDISLFVFKYKTVFGDNWMNALVHLIMCLRQNNIHTCFIYDTAAPEEKDEERKRRKEQRTKLDTKLFELSVALEKAKLTGEIDPVLIEFNKTLPEKKSLLIQRTERSIDLNRITYEVEKKLKQVVSIGDSDFDVSKKLLDVFGIPWFQADMEAETTCADLCIQGKVDVVFSDDTDVLCYGAPNVVSKINTADNTAILVSHSELLECLELTKEQFIDFCIMCGTDYNKNIPKIGPETAYKLIKQHGSIEYIAESGVDVSILNHVRVRQLFKDYKRSSYTISYCRPPNLRDIEMFLVQNNIKINPSKIIKFVDTQEIIVCE